MLSLERGKGVGLALGVSQGEIRGGLSGFNGAGMTHCKSGHSGDDERIFHFGGLKLG
jgi:hypothetical protein